MITLTFQDFMSGTYADEDYRIYILYDKETCLYVGISDQPWNRWFGGSYSHMLTKADGMLLGLSSIGDEVVKALPRSLEWSVELWTVKDGVGYFREDIASIGYIPDRLDARAIEQFFIKRNSPIFNGTA